MNASAQVIEHRWGTRIPLDAPAELRTDGGHAICVIVGNASLSGAFVRTAAKLPILSCVLVHVLDGPTQWLEACVVRHDDEGMGLEWLDPGLRPICALLAMRHDDQRLRPDNGGW
jgi:hypothetical protein